MIFVLLGCQADSATAFRDALASGACAEVADTTLRDRCWVEHLKCTRVEDPREQAECAFREAEATRNPSRCADAGPFAADCRMHLWTASFREWAPKRALPGEVDAIAAEKIAAYGFDVTDPAPWSAWYRWTLGHSRPLDRQLCRPLLPPERAEACLQTALSLYGDFLNVARDQRTYPCDGGPLPPLLQHTPDPELDALRAARTDLCPG